ncbi:amidase family protein [Nocardia sp. BMG51109]|uniref:amidase family protein n=1 Tax=Nocardia sp. BMG51109 TaxID=1056816 RepID=UPI0004654F2C|nr:amidase family protein [Nocardia sp. BMG51109]
MSAPAASDIPHDPAVWRIVGAPLVAATGHGALDGRTVAVKDLFAVAGFATGAGVSDFGSSRDPADAHAPVVSALLDAGAHIGGIAHTDEFAFSINGINRTYGTAVNPAAPDRLPGGSTCGPAVAVARGEAAIGLGTDTAGSIRVPAAYQCLWGLRTTHGAVPTTGVVPLAPSFDAVGWVTRDVHTLIATTDVLVPRIPPPARAQDLVVDPRLLRSADPEIADAAFAAARALSARSFEPAIDPDAIYEAFRAVQAHEAWTAHGPWVTAHPDSLSDDVRQRFRYGATLDEAAVADARRVLASAARALRAALAGRALLLPTAAAVAPLRTSGAPELDAARARTVRLTCLASAAGLPAVNIPIRTADGLPAGLCLVGARNTDHHLVRTARTAAAALPRHLHPT